MSMPLKPPIQWPCCSGWGLHRSLRRAVPITFWPSFVHFAKGRVVGSFLSMFPFDQIRISLLFYHLIFKIILLPLPPPLTNPFLPVISENGNFILRCVSSVLPRLEYIFVKKLDFSKISYPGPMKNSLEYENDYLIENLVPCTWKNSWKISKKSLKLFVKISDGNFVLVSEKWEATPRKLLQKYDVILGKIV